MKNIRQEIKDLKRVVGLAWKDKCTQAESEKFKHISVDNLPENISFDADYGEYYKYQEADVSEEEKQEFYTLKQLSYLKSIRKCLIFFVVLTIISLIASVIIGLVVASL